MLTLAPVKRSAKRLRSIHDPFEDDRRLSLLEYFDQVKSGALHVHTRPGDRHYILRGDSLFFSPTNVLLTSLRGEECFFPKRWLLSINPVIDL